MQLDVAIFLAALGITTLELVEAAAVGLALYGDSRRPSAFLFVALGVVVVFVPMFALGALITLLPLLYVRLVGGVLLLYFGLRLIRSARKSVVRSRTAGGPHEIFQRSVFATGFSVGAIEAFEAAIVLIGLLPNGYQSTVLGIGGGVVFVVGATYALRNQVRKVKQADTKVVVSALLLSFSVFWFGEAFVEVDDVVLIPLFVVFVSAVYFIANRPSGHSTPPGPG